MVDLLLDDGPVDLTDNSSLNDKTAPILTISPTCDFCARKIALEPVVCTHCHLAYYCSESHLKLHKSEHQQDCTVLSSKYKTKEIAFLELIRKFYSIFDTKELIQGYRNHLTGFKVIERKVLRPSERKDAQSDIIMYWLNHEQGKTPCECLPTFHFNVREFWSILCTANDVSFHSAFIDSLRTWYEQTNQFYEVVMPDGSPLMVGGIVNVTPRIDKRLPVVIPFFMSKDEKPQIRLPDRNGASVAVSEHLVMWFTSRAKKTFFVDLCASQYGFMRDEDPYRIYDLYEFSQLYQLHMPMIGWRDVETKLKRGKNFDYNASSIYTKFLFEALRKSYPLQ